MPTEFSEIQRFRQPWLWAVIVLSSALLFIVFGWGLMEQLVFGRPWGNRPLPDALLVMISSAVLLINAVLVYLFYSLRLITRIDSAGVFIRFYPFPVSVIPFADIQSCVTRTYRPLLEYGGWGIRYGRSGKAYNISGDQGVQLVLKTGKRILIGSQQSGRLAAAINRHLDSPAS